MMTVVQPAGSGDIISKAIARKVNELFDSDDGKERLRVLVERAEGHRHALLVTAYFVRQHCARNGVMVTQTAGGGAAYPVFSQFRKMSSLYRKKHFDPTPPICVDGTIPVAQAHFLHWFISRGIDHMLLPQWTAISAEMMCYQQSTSRTYRCRQRQRILNRKRSHRELLPPLRPTAAHEARQKRPSVEARPLGPT
jgi:hypothetical protein